MYNITEYNGSPDYWPIDRPTSHTGTEPKFTLYLSTTEKAELITACLGQSHQPSH